MTIEAPSGRGADEAGGETPGDGIVTAISGFGFIRCIVHHPSQPADASKSAASAEPKMSMEDLTRKEMIDPQLELAGWFLADHSKVRIEIPVDGYNAEPWNGVSDYTLYRENGEVLALVETKRTTHDARLAEAQLTH